MGLSDRSYILITVLSVRECRNKHGVLTRKQISVVKFPFSRFSIKAYNRRL